MIMIISYGDIMAVLPAFGLPVGIIAGATRRARASAFRYTGMHVDSRRWRPRGEHRVVVGYETSRGQHIAVGGYGVKIDPCQAISDSSISHLLTMFVANRGKNLWEVIANHHC